MTELDKLQKYLEANKYSFIRHDNEENVLNGYIISPGLHQIVVYLDAECTEENRLWDVICHRGSYGYEKGLLEYYDGKSEPTGWLTAEDVIRLISNKEINQDKKEGRNEYH